MSAYARMVDWKSTAPHEEGRRGVFDPFLWTPSQRCIAAHAQPFVAKSDSTVLRRDFHPDLLARHSW